MSLAIYMSREKGLCDGVASVSASVLLCLLWLVLGSCFHVFVRVFLHPSRAPSQKQRLVHASFYFICVCVFCA